MAVTRVSFAPFACRHHDAEPNFFFWEPVVLLERIILVGFVQWMPSSLGLLRLLLGQVIVLMYSIMLMFLRPYKRQVRVSRAG